MGLKISFANSVFKHGRGFAMGLLCGSVAWIAPPAGAESAARAETEEDPGLLALEEIVVTGTASRGTRKLDVSFAVTTKSLQEIQNLGPLSTADVYRIAPGVWVESSGGETGANASVRGFPFDGDAPFVQLSVDGVPIYPDNYLAFFEHSSILRLDETFERVEALRGGPTPIYSGMPGATFNFITKKGTEAREGTVRLTGSDYDLRRIDVHYSGPLSDDWLVSTGGFYRTSDGIRSTEYPADRGGQFSLSLTRKLDNGHINVYARHLDERNAFVLPIPLRDPGDPRAFSDDFDPNTGTFQSNDFRLVQLEVDRGELLRRDLADGRGAEVSFLGGEVDLQLDNGWHLLNKFGFTSGDVFSRSPFSGALPGPAAAVLANQVSRANNDAGVLAAAGRPATTGTFSFVNSDAAIAPNRQLIDFGWWTVDKDLQSFTNDLRVDRDFGSHFFTLGLYFADWSDRELWYLGNNVLATATENSRLVDLALDNGVQVTRDGFIGAPSFPVDATHNGTRIAFYASDEWQIDDRWRVDGGVRVDRFEADTTTSTGTNIYGVDLDDDPLTLYNNSAGVFSGRFASISVKETEFAYTLGVNYGLTDRMAMFGRWNSGVRFPTLTDVHFGRDVVQEVRQAELGFKAQTERVGVFATAFLVDFKNFPTSELILTDDGLQRISGVADTETLGLELEIVAEPFDGLQIALTGTFQNPELKSFRRRGAGGNLEFASSGNQVKRQPKTQFRLSPIYQWSRGEVFASYTWVDDRYSDNDNTQLLPSYGKWDAGVNFYLSENLSLHVVGDNLSNEVALTEGNPRVLGAGVNEGVFLARPIFGRSFRFSLKYQF